MKSDWKLRDLCVVGFMRIVNLLFFYCNIKYYSDLCISSLTKLLKELRSRFIIKATLAVFMVNYP